MNREAEAKHRLTRRRLRKGVYVLPSFITCINIYMGFYAVVESLKGYKYVALNDPEMATRHFDIAALCIGWSVLCDFLDGRIARLMHATSEFGVQLDSLADVLSFGIAPAVLLYTWGFSGIPAFQKLAWGAAFIHLICCALRLARFNVQATKPIPGDPKTAKRFFVGLPTPAAAGLLAAIVHFTPLPVVYQETYYRLFGQEFLITPTEWALGLFVLAITLALLMVSTLRFNSFKDLGPYARHPQIVLLSLGLLIFLVYNYSQWTLLILAIIYAGQGPAGKLASLFRRKTASVPTPTSAETL
ncbi:phosphatidylcholine/phosphatidylserine synthase [Chloracidobacterium sp. D]|jgi:CDP-diacylglycerol--serine O-phosphatidyltransferase|uniref:CDP-alcohol phosphatidyltransferase family protein n=1 Tax=Chloracidobacterium sp. D TaxID=2821536 RepID=UPI001B8CACCC|nr:phosphatidylcholine/phosphatidylserine synthase [Chloracidobacterium sp. D]QUV82117.1 phosphatidylcholine/phosphatidylserine synthase [Chloracidobacterium sp. D]